jgi:Flp pilus assembly protein TadD
MRHLYFHVSKVVGLFLVISTISNPTEANCENRVARLMSLQGRLTIQENGPEEWKSVSPEQEFCRGDRIRTSSQSRATLELNNKTFITLDQQTTIVFSGIQARAPSWLDLLQGVIYMRSRTPFSMDVRTRFVNAAIRGTEFLVSSDDAMGQVSVLEGVVEASNDKGSVTLSDGQAAVIKAGQAPVRKLLISPRDAVQWALYYPPVIDLRSLRQETTNPAEKRAVSLYIKGDSLGALAVLDAEENPDALLRASLLIGLGRVGEARPLLEGAQDAGPRRADALALRSIVALARNDKDQALALAQRATEIKPSSPVGWTALSYAKQAEFDLESALSAANQAAKLDPDNALARAREAELLASLGRRSEARVAAEDAIRINPKLARAWAVLAYAQLNEMDVKAAAESFRKAVDLDNADPLPRFGLGLAKIRMGELESGTADFEIAANLDPDDSLIRSYLGKAYYEQKNGKVAATEYDLAKQLDPKDPTPWFYEAIKKQTDNRPTEALTEMQKAIELNDNRSVYRSKQLLDSDLAARSASLARIYRDLAFENRALVEGWNSVEYDPTDFSGHRLLADSYSSLPRHEIARVSELLVSQLLQPLSILPVQPHLAESNLAILREAGPQTPSFNEFNPLFARNGVALQASGLAGSNSTYGDEVTLSGIHGPFSYSFGQLHFQTDGFRPNNDLQQNIYNAYFQASITPSLNMMFEARHRDIDYGDLAFVFDLKNYNPYFRDRVTIDSLRLGGHYEFNSRSHLISSLTYFSNRNNQDNIGININDTNNFYIGETQFLSHGELADFIVGQGYLSLDGEVGGAPGFAIPVFSHQANGYIYSHVRFPDNISWTLGFSVDSLEDQHLSGINQINRVNPKFGMRWFVTPDTLLRVAAFSSMRRPLPGNQTIEPTQIAGFNQYYDDSGGTLSTRYGIGLDQKFSKQLFVGLEGSHREISKPVVIGNQIECGISGTCWQSSRESFYRAYLNWTPISSLSISSEYQFDDYTSIVYQTQTHLFPTSIRYFLDSGIFLNARATYVYQRCDMTMTSCEQNASNNLFANYNSQAAREQFVLFDVGIGFRLPKRYGIMRFEVRNLLDQSFNYMSADNRDTTLIQGGGSPLFLPMRTFYGSMTLSF